MAQYWLGYKEGSQIKMVIWANSYDDCQPLSYTWYKFEGL